jgi:flagellin
MGSSAFQVGANAGESISVDLSSSMKNTAIGASATGSIKLSNIAVASTVTADTAYVAGNLVIGGENVAAPTAATTAIAITNGRSANSAIQLAAAINLNSDKTGVKATAKAATTTIASANFTGVAATATSVGARKLSINSVEIVSHVAGEVGKDAEGLAVAINAKSKDTGVTASVNAAKDLILTASDGRNIEIEEITGDAADLGYFVTTAATAATYKGFFKGSIELTSDSAIAVDDTITGTNPRIIDAASEKTIAATTIDSASVTSVSNAETAIRNIDSALSDVDSFRGGLGAMQARFESVVASLSSTVESLSAARSRVMDADFASETANMTKNQILQQAGVAMVSQANSAPQSVLSLLG